MWTYPIKVEKDDNNTYLATSADFPELTTFGATPVEALDNARDAIEEAVAARMARKEAIPRPSSRGKHRTALPTQTVLKILLYETMREKRVSKSKLAAKLDVHRPQIDRLLNIRHSTNLGTIDDAFTAIGFRVEVDIVPKKSD